MSRRCALTGTGIQYGNNVSHSNRKTRRRFMPNVKKTSINSDALGSVTLKVTTATLRTIDHNGGLDAYLLSTADSKLTDEAVRLKRQISKKTPKAAKTA